jgi:hypothetical protein
MNDDDSILLASAYLDGDVSADERARVEADAELLELVEQLRQVRAVIADAGTPAISVREAHLAAALSAWDRLPDVERSGVLRDATPRGIDSATAAAAASITSATSRRGDRRSVRSNRWMLAAAAALLAVLGGGVILQSVVGDRASDDDQMASLDAGDTEADMASDAMIESAEGGAGEDVLRESGSPADDTGELATADAAPGADTFAIDAGAPPAELDLEELLTREQLAIFAADAVDAPRASGEPAETSAPADGTGVEAFEFPLCGPVDVLVGPALYQGQFVVVGIDDSRNLALAHLVADCSEVARVPLP